jgi:hypothetical protein
MIERAPGECHDKTMLQFESLILTVFPVQELFGIEFRNESRSHRR